MILDLHTHSVRSDDGRAKVENYCQWVRRKELPLDGIVLTEHRQFDAASDYRPLEDQYGLLILKASEVETDYGHCLLFGVNADLVHAFDFARIDNPLAEVIEAADRHGAFAAPCHPGRRNVGLFAHYESKPPVAGVEVVEVYNGGSIPGEDERSVQEAQRHGYRGIGGSDSHIVGRVGLCATEFTDDIATMDDLVTALRAGSFEAADMADVDLAAIRAQWVGRVFQELDLVVDQQRMLDWAHSCGETDPRFVDPEHPDFQASTAFPTHINAARMLPDDFTQIGSGRGIDGGKSIEWHRPMRAGDRLHATVEIADVYEKTGRSGTMTFIINRMTFTNAAGEVVATVDWRMIRQG